MSQELIEKTECQKLLIQSTTKIYSSNGEFIGTGFFILPNVLASCYHVFFNENYSIKKFKIEGFDFLIPLEDDKTFYVEGLDLICVNITNELGKQCVPLAHLQSHVDDKLWAYTFNKDYINGASLRSELIEDANHNGQSVYRIEDDTIKDGSSGTPLWNTSKHTFLGVVYWLKEHKRHALVIPAIRFHEHFPALYQQNVTYHQENPIWKQAIELDKSRQPSAPSSQKRSAQSEQFEIYSHQYVGRTGPKTQLRKFLVNEEHFLFIYGIGGIGKSHLVKSVIEELELPFIYIRLTPTSNIKGLAYQLGLENIEQETNNLINQALINAIQDIKDRVIIIDDFYEIDDDVKLQSTLLQLATISQGKVILISRALPELYISPSYTLPKVHIEYLGRKEHRYFVREFSQFKSIGNRELEPYEEKLWEISNGHPLISQIIINYSDNDIYDDFDIDALEAWNFEADKEGKIFIAKLLDTVLKKGKSSEKEFLLNFSLMLGEVPSVLLKKLPNFNRDNLKSLIRRKHFIHTLTKKDNQKSYNLHPLVRELLRKKAGERPNVHHLAAEFFHEKAQHTNYDDMIAFNNALYHFQNADGGQYEQFIKSTNSIFVGDSIKKLIDENIDSSIARLKERQRRKPLDLATYNELSRLYMFRGQEESCFATINKGLEIDTVNEVLLFSKAYAYKYFSKGKEAEVIFEQLANLDNTYAIFQLCQIEYQAKNWLSCNRLCEWILWLEPGNSQALLYKGMVLFQQRKYDEAQVVFRRILEQDSENSQALQYKGMVLFQQRKYEEAQVVFERILEQDSDNIQALQYKGMVLFQQRKYDKALVVFERILEQDSDNVQALQYKGMVLFQQRKHDEAQVFFERIIEQEPENSQALQYRGMVLFQQRKYDEAQVVFENILEQDSENSQALQYKGMVLFQQRKYDEAQVFFENILEQEPDNSQALLYKGMALFHQRKHDQAQVFFENILEQDSDNIQALQYKGMVLFQQRKYDEAQVFFEKKLQQEPDNSQALQYKGMVLFKQRKYDEARVFFEKKLQREPRNSQALLYMGKSLMRLNSYLEAERTLEQANNFDRRNAFIKTELATALGHNGKIEAAIEMYEVAIQIRPRNKQSYNGLYNIYQDQLNDYIKAIEIVDRLLDLKIYDFRLLRAGIYLLIHRKYKIYDYEKARIYLDALKKVRPQLPKTKRTIVDLDIKIRQYSQNNRGE